MQENFMDKIVIRNQNNKFIDGEARDKIIVAFDAGLDRLEIDGKEVIIINYDEIDGTQYLEVYVELGIGEIKI